MTGANIIHLPWPPKELSPNSRKDRRSATAKRRGYREAGFFAAKAAGVVVPADAKLSIMFFPPDAVRRDLDNMLASIKVGLDGIAQASGVDDYGWSLSIERKEKIKGGAVLVHVATDNGWQSIGDVAAKMIKGAVE